MGSCTAQGGFWGEHEIDWILLCTPKRMPRMALNENEVAAVKAFTQAELKEWMATRAARGDEVSPWFGVMEKTLVYKWWDAVLQRRIDSVVERGTIHRQHDLEARATGVPSLPMPPAFAACLASTRATGSAGAAAASLPRSLGAAAAAPASSSAAGAAGSFPVGANAQANSNSNGHSKSGSKSSGHADGAAAVVPGATAVVNTKKQGAYGKVQVHSEPMLSQLSHLDEVFVALGYKLGLSSAVKVAPLAADAPPAQVFCERMLCKVSRSFAMVIQQLPPHLRASICVFYLVLRGLDTVEDDMEAFKERNSVKLVHLRAFHSYLRDPDFCMDGVGEGDERYLLQHFQQVNAMFAGLPAVDQDVIADICARMGDGMASFSGRDLRQGTEDVADYNLYCHYVAGLVGEGLSRLFVAHGDEAPEVADDVKLADDMGLFLQKTNIIRDYLEDFVEGRAFWPREIWAQYGSALGDFGKNVAAAATAGTCNVHCIHFGSRVCRRPPRLLSQQYAPCRHFRLRSRAALRRAATLQLFPRHVMLTEPWDTHCHGTTHARRP